MHQEEQKQGNENIHCYVTKAQSGNEALDYFNKKEEEKKLRASIKGMMEGRKDDEKRGKN